jgi:glycerol-3-phosphate dehydrogenase (NAD(P)+)
MSETEITAVIGAGSWGTALARVLRDNGHEVRLWSCIDSEIEMLRQHHMQMEKLPGVLLPAGIVYTTDMREAMADASVIVLAVPSPFTRSTAGQMAAFYEKGQIIVSVAKGIEEDTLLTLTEVIKEEIPNCEAAVLCGPTHAEEVGIGLPTAIVAGASRKEVADYIQSVFMNKAFRVYTSPDMLGMQVGAALKNVIALAAGCSDGLGCGDNTKAALITRGIAEISQIGIAMGGKPETFSGLTGIGDLIVTCASMHSRNRRAGILIGKGKTADEAMKEVQQGVEGVYSAKAALQLADKYETEAPIIRAVNRVLFGNEKPMQAVEDLMLRDSRIENSGLEW